MELEELNSAMREEVEEQYPPIRHPLINRYVNYLGQRIVAYDDKMPDLLYKFYVLKTKDVNAFSLPSGSTYITLGFLSMAEKEEEVLGALAHELAHQRAMHLTSLWKARTIGAISNFQKSVFRGDYFNSRYFGKNGFFYYGDSMEYEADKIATQLLQQAGFSPKGVLHYLNKLRSIKISHPDRLSLWESTGPPIKIRIEKLKAWLASNPDLQDPKKKVRSSLGTFKEVKALLRNPVPKGASPK